MWKTTTPKDEKHLKQLEYFRNYREKTREKRRELNREWIQNNREKYNAQKAKYRDKLKLEVFNHYWKWEIKCTICWFNDIDTLCLDHIENNWNIHRKEMWVTKRAWINTYEVLRKQWYPEWIQILCANCNLKKEIKRKREIRLKNIYYKEYYGNTNTPQSWL